MDLVQILGWILVFGLVMIFLLSRGASFKTKGAALQLISAATGIMVLLWVLKVMLYAFFLN